MDFILEHNDDPIPDATSAAPATSSAEPQGEDDEEDASALGLQLGAVADAGVEARVSIISYSIEPGDFIFDVPEHQMFTMRKDFQKHGAGQLPRREEWARSVRRVHRRCAFVLTLVDKQYSTTALKIKPLTEEEKKQKLEELREKMSEKRTRKAAEEAKEAKANELIRRKAGKVCTMLDPSPPPLQATNHQPIVAHTHQQEAAQIKEDMKNKQILKDLEAKRRGSFRFISSPPLLLSPNVSFRERK
jgi:hypothetical protein